MAGADLTTELRRRAAEAADAIMSAARADADRIAADAERAIEERRSAVLKSREEEYRAEARASIAVERHEAMRAVLLAKTRVVDRVLQSAQGLLSEAAGTTAYGSSLAGEIGEAIAFVGSAGTVIRCSAEIQPKVHEALREMPEVSVETFAGGTGFMAIGEGGNVEVDGTLEARLARLAPTLAIEIHERLEER